jgi:hypothetical protein
MTVCVLLDFGFFFFNFFRKWLLSVVGSLPAPKEEAISKELDMPDSESENMRAA